MQPFRLSKWYFDGISEDGRVLIAYSARLQWGGFSVPYSSYLYLPPQGPCRVKSRFSAVSEPQEDGRRITWEDGGFRLQGTWEGQAPPLEATLFESEEGSVQWHCRQPAARCRILLGDEAPLEGWGYAERLDMSIPPWKLGFQTLRWGRFAHPEAPLVWIDWSGPVNRQWVFDGRERVGHAVVHDAYVELPPVNKRLVLKDPVVLEETLKIREVVGSLLRWLPGFDGVAPLAFLNAREVKWRSAGRLVVDGTVRQSGWVIHERIVV